MAIYTLYVLSIVYSNTYYNQTQEGGERADLPFLYVINTKVPSYLLCMMHTSLLQVAPL